MATRISKFFLAHAVPALSLTLLGCSSSPESAEPPAATEGSEMADEQAQAPYAPAEQAAAPDAPAPSTATAEFETAEGIELQGQAQFTAEPDGVRAHVEIEKATPGKHGIHVHEKGDCSDIPGKSMGSHFAPQGHEHALPGTPQRHLGDLGNIEVTGDGNGILQIKIDNATLDDGPNSFVGKALVIHEKEDVGTQPSGDSGSPIACAIIKAE